MKIYVRLYHGRKTAEDHLDDWGANGPIIGPVGITWTYGSIKLHGEEDFSELIMINDLIYFDGMYYGDFEIVTGIKLANDLSRAMKVNIVSWPTFNRINKPPKQ